MRPRLEPQQLRNLLPVPVSELVLLGVKTVTLVADVISDLDLLLMINIVGWSMMW
jgi:hypothetical protein